MTTDQQDTRTPGDHPPAGGSEDPPANRSGGVDWLVFGVTAVASVAFVIWGIADRVSLATQAADGKEWVIAKGGWLFVLLASLFVI
ncbi:MAG TPA: BCCT family transporter, partial [Nocardioidaceae bacterium]|nr:BCCT family transporter [Nocardioidaceae bacterium]